jgi:DNA mismatch repair protein MutL
LSLETNENIVRAISKRAASRINLKNEVLDMNTLIDRLFACQQPNYTSEGNPTFIILGLEKISEFFKN